MVLCCFLFRLLLYAVGYVTRNGIVPLNTFMHFQKRISNREKNETKRNETTTRTKTLDRPFENLHVFRFLFNSIRTIQYITSSHDSYYFVFFCLSFSLCFSSIFVWTWLVRCWCFENRSFAMVCVIILRPVPVLLHWCVCMMSTAVRKHSFVRLVFMCVHRTKITTNFRTKRRKKMLKFVFSPSSHSFGCTHITFHHHRK